MLKVLIVGGKLVMDVSGFEGDEFRCGEIAVKDTLFTPKLLALVIEGHE